MTDIYTLFKDLVLLGIGIAGVITAREGLKTWNRQLRGGVEYELVRRLLRCAYQLREAFKKVREPVMFAEEQAATSDEQAGTSAEERRHYGLWKGYTNRWKAVTEVRTELDTALLEAEVLWGSEIRNIVAPLLALERELFVAVQFTVRMTNPRETREGVEAMSRILRSRRQVLYQTDEDDAFRTDVASAIDGLEAYLRPHLAFRRVIT